MNYEIIFLVHDLREQSSPLLPPLRKSVALCEGTVRLLGDRQQTPEPATALSPKLPYITF